MALVFRYKKEDQIESKRQNIDIYDRNVV